MILVHDSVIDDQRPESLTTITHVAKGSTSLGHHPAHHPPMIAHPKLRTWRGQVNNAFFSWQLTHHSEQIDAEGQALWPELYGDSWFAELKALVKMCCVDYLHLR